MPNAILYWLNTGIPWRDLPERFGPWQSVYSQFRAWTWGMGRYPQNPDQAGVGGRNNADAGQHHDQGPPARQRSLKGGITRKPDGAEEGLTTKVHAVTDELGNPLRFLLSGGKRNDICMAQALWSLLI